MTEDRDLPRPDPGVEAAARSLAERAPVPAHAGSVRFGTAGWTDPTLISSSSFYPSSVRSAADRLGHYASHFPMVEVDATYYAIPAPSVAERWVERTPAGFVFDIKAHPVFTGHPVNRTRLPKELAALLQGVRPDRQRLYPKDLPSEVRDALRHRFREMLEPLRRAGKLGCVMVQLPPWTTATRGAGRHVESLSELLPDTRIAVEFRHPSWLEPSRRERVRDLLSRNGLAYVCVDEPDVMGGGVPAVTLATRPDLALVRFHGHNVGGWRRGASVLERFNYLYGPDELRAWAQPVRALADSANEVHAVFNNCVRDYAVVNAKDLAALMLPLFETQPRPQPNDPE
ncbi:MAG: DUF72 domain-containing protein [Myxococcota bacterium]